MNSSRGARWAALLTLVVVASLGVGLWIVGSPAEERQRRLDGQRVLDLMAISDRVQRYAQESDALPADLTSLMEQPEFQAGRFRRVQLRDPVTREPYEYEVLGPRTFRLCAQFSRATSSPFPDDEREMDPWSHGAGRHCFERQVQTSSQG